VVELDKVSGGYFGKNVVRGVTAAFREAEITAVIGANGCGKSTLLKIICGHLTPSSGGVAINGKPASALSRNELARLVSYLPQSRQVPDITVGGLVLHGRFPHLAYPRVYRAEDKRIAESAMERAGVAEHRDKHLNRLSGGERQKAYLAMLIAQDAPAVLLDEPFTHLDIANQAELCELLVSLKSAGKTVVAVMHELSLAMRIADDFAVMKNGEIIAKTAALTEDIIKEAFGASVGYFGFK